MDGAQPRGNRWYQSMSVRCWWCRIGEAEGPERLCRLCRFEVHHRPLEATGHPGVYRFPNMGGSSEGHQ